MPDEAIDTFFCFVRRFFDCFADVCKYKINLQVLTNGTSDIIICLKMRREGDDCYEKRRI